jgi:hypothetical protein
MRDRSPIPKGPRASPAELEHRLTESRREAELIAARAALKKAEVGMIEAQFHLLRLEGLSTRLRFSCTFSWSSWLGSGCETLRILTVEC